MFEHDHDLDHTIVVRPALHDFRMYVTPRFRDQYEKVPYEKYTSRLISRMMRTASTFVDVGAHCGFFSILAARSNPAARVISFEPAPQSLAILNRNMALNGLKTVEVHKLVISDREGKAPFYMSQASDKRGFSRHPQNATLGVKDVTTCRLDSLLAGVIGPTLVKIDAGGSVRAVLHGMQETFKRIEKLALFVTLNPKRMKVAGDSPANLLRHLGELGLESFLIDDPNQRHYRIDTNADWAAFMNPESHANLLCLPKAHANSGLFFSHMAALGGAERSLLELVDELVAEHWMLCTVICPSKGPLVEALLGCGAAVLIAGYKWWCSSRRDEIGAGAWLGSSIRSLLPLVPTLRTINPHVVITQTIVVPWGAVIAGILERPHVWSVCEYGEKDYNLHFRYPFSEILSFVEGSSSHLFASTPSLLNELFPGIDPSKASILYRHIPVPEFDQLAPPAHLWIAPDALRIGIFATIHEGKGQEDVIRAVGMLKGRGRNVELVVAGHATKPYMARLLQLVNEIDISSLVQFTGFFPDPYPAMASTDVVVSCSRREAFGRSVVEAMLLGRPVVYAKAGGHCDYMIDRTTGLGYTAGNAEELADRIDDLIRDPELRSVIGRQARAHAQYTFTREQYGGKAHAALASLSRRDQAASLSMSPFVKDLIAACARVHSGHKGKGVRTIAP